MQMRFGIFFLVFEEGQGEFRMKLYFLGAIQTFFQVKLSRFNFQLGLQLSVSQQQVLLHDNFEIPLEGLFFDELIGNLRQRDRRALNRVKKQSLVFRVILWFYKSHHILLSACAWSRVVYFKTKCFIQISFAFSLLKCRLVLQLRDHPFAGKIPF